MKLLPVSSTNTGNKGKREKRGESSQYNRYIGGDRKIYFDIQGLVELIVCDTEQLEYMVHCCENCPSFQAQQTFLENKFTELNIDDNVSYSQWEKMDRTSLKTNTLTVDEFIELLVYSQWHFQQFFGGASFFNECSKEKSRCAAGESEAAL